MPLWLLLGLFGVGVVALSSRPVTEEDVVAVTNHALIAERDPNVILDLQHALSMAGRFELAELMRSRWQSLTQELAKEIEATVTYSPAFEVTSCEQRALEWSRMYGWTMEEARQKVRERVSSCQ